MSDIVAAQAADQRIRELAKDREGLQVRLGTELLRLRRARLWADLGFRSFTAYTTAVGLEQTLASTYMRVARVFGAYPDLPAYQNLRALLPLWSLLKGEEELRMVWLEEARQRSTNEFKTAVQAERTALGETNVGRSIALQVWVNEDERDVIEQAVQRLFKQDPDVTVRGEAIARMATEFLERHSDGL